MIVNDTAPEAPSGGHTDVEDLDMPGQGFPAVANRVAGPAVAAPAWD